MSAFAGVTDDLVVGATPVHGQYRPEHDIQLIRIKVRQPGALEVIRGHVAMAGAPSQDDRHPGHLFRALWPWDVVPERHEFRSARFILSSDQSRHLGGIAGLLMGYDAHHRGALPGASFYFSGLRIYGRAVVLPLFFNENGRLTPGLIPECDTGIKLVEFLGYMGDKWYGLYQKGRVDRPEEEQGEDQVGSTLH